MAAVGALKASVLTVPDTHVSATHGVRDALCDINVFSYGAHHMMGLDADRDMDAVITGVMTRFIKNPEDKAQTVAKHSQAGVTEVYFEGAYPYMVMKSAVDQPDAPKGKFLKSASYRAPEFYDVVVVPNNSCADQMNQTYGEGYGTDWKYQEKGAKV